MSDDTHKEKPVQVQPLEEPTPMSREQLESLFREHHSRVIGAAYRITGSSEEAEDVLQTVFLRLLRREDAPDLSRGAAGYLHRAAVNAALDLVRARKSAKTFSVDDAEHDLPASNEPGPHGIVADRERRDRLRRALSELNPKTAEIFALRYFEGYGNQEIARLTGSTDGAIGVTLHRARHRLQELLAPSEGGE